MFASNMKILTLNSNNTSPIAPGGTGTQTTSTTTNIKELNNHGNDGGGTGSNNSSGNMGSNHKSNKREQKHNSKTKFIHSNSNSNKMQQQVTQQQQQKYHNNTGGGGNKLKKQHYNNSNNNNSNNNSNSTSSLNRKKFYQQQQQQQQQHHYQQQYLTNLQHNLNTTTATTNATTSTSATTITNNNNSNLVKNQNYTQIDLLIQQQHQHNIVISQNINNNPLEPTCTCLLQQNNCDKLSISTCSSTSLSSNSSSNSSAASAAASLQTHSHSSSTAATTSDYQNRQHQQQLHTICYDNHLKSTQTKSSSSSIAAATSSSSASSACISCWTNFAKLSQQGKTTPSNLQEFVASAVAAAAAASSKCNTNQNLTRTTSTSSSSSNSILSTTTGISNTNSSSPLSNSSASKKKSFWKNSNSSGGNSSGGANNISTSGYSSANSNQSPRYGKEKLHVSEKNLITNTSNSASNNNNSRQSLGKIGNNNSNNNSTNANNQKYSTTVAANINNSNSTNSSTKQITKNQVQTIVDKIAMNTSMSSAATSGSITSIKSFASTTNSSNNTKPTPNQQSKQHDILEKPNDSKQMLKSITSTSTNGNSETNKSQSLSASSTTTSATSSSTTTSVPSSPNSYTLDFLHSVGVKMTGVALRSTSSSAGTQASSTNYGHQTTTNSPIHSGGYPYTGMSTTNQRQTRYMYGGSSNSGSGSNGNQHHHHHQPSQLTIASFLQKELLGGDNILTNTNSTTHSNAGSTSSSNSNSRNVNSYNDQQSHYSQQQHHQRYHHNYYGTTYQQQTGGIQHTSYGGIGGYGVATSGELARLVSNGGGSSGGGGNGQRNSCFGYANYHTSTATDNGINKNSSISQQQTRQLQNNLNNYTNSLNNNNNQANKKSTSYASSTTSTCSSSSSKSISSNSSNTSSGRQLQQQTSTSAVQDNSSNSGSNLNLAIETLPSKNLGAGNQRGNHRGHHHTHHGHHHHNHHGHHHHQHSMMNSPNLLQHQNYYNLTYVSTDGSVNGTGGGSTAASANSRGCSPAPQSLPPTPLSTTNCHSPKPLDNNSGPVAMLMNFNASHLQYGRYPNAQQQMAVQQQQQFHQFQQQHQQNFLNKKMLAPLTLSMPSPSPSPTPPSSAPQIPPPPPPHNIICCSQLDEATTAAAAAAATSSSSTASSGIIAGNDYDSDTSSNHSAAQHKYHSLKSIKSSMSASSSASSSSVSTNSLPVMGGGQQQIPQTQNCSQPSTPANCGPTTPLHSPLDYSYGIAPSNQAFPNLQGAQQLSAPQHNYKVGNENGQLPHVYANNGSTVISLLNLPSKSPNSYSEDDFQSHAHQQFYFNAAGNHATTADHLNIASALTAVASRSNTSSGYWSPSHHNQFLYQQNSSSQVALIPATTSSSSCGSSSASISPRLPNDDMQQSQHQMHHSCCLSNNNSSTLPSPCTSCLNEQFNSIIIGNSNNVNSDSVSSNGSVISINSANGGGGHNYKRGSSQLLAQQQQRLIAQQTYQSSSSSSTSSLSGSSASTLTSAVRARSGGAVGNVINTNNNGRNNQLQLPLQNSMGTSLGNGINQSQLPPPLPPTQQHLYAHHQQQQQQQQTLPPPLPPHNLLYNNPQTHHIRALSNSSINSSVHDFFTHTPPDRFLARAHLVEAKEAPATLLNNSKWDHLSQGIWKKFVSSQQTEETFKQKMRLWRYLYLFIKNAYPRYGLYLVGSTISGFGSDSSDVDMCLVSRSASSIDPRMEALFNLTVLRDCLSKSGEFENFNLIEAKVPILRFRDRIHQLEVDLNFNNCVGIKNTHLLYCYSQLDWRLRPLVLVTKLWAQYHNINNAKNMTISSYSLVLMVIHFLQYAVNPPVLPCLHEIFPDKFPLLRSNDFGYVDMNETMGPYESKNTQTIGELFLYFLEYYSCFDYTQFAISVRTGGLLPINVCRTAKSIKNDIHQWKELCIEEPFDLTNTARSVYDYETFERVKAVFVASWRILQETLDLNSVFSPIMIPSPASSCISTAASSVGNNVCCIITNTNATTTTQSATNENETSDITIVNDTRNNLEQYLMVQPPMPIKDFSLTENMNNDSNDNELDVVKNYQENNENEEIEFVENQQQQEEEDDIIIDVIDDDVDDNDDYVENYTAKGKGTVLTTDTMASNCSSICQKLNKRKDLNRTLTPKQMKIYEEITSSPKTNTKIINRSASNSSNNKTATNIIS